MAIEFSFFRFHGLRRGLESVPAPRLGRQDAYPTVIAGLFVCQSVPRWNIAAARRRRSSSKGRDWICRPMGSGEAVVLPPVRPQGMLIPAMPARFVVTV